MQKESLICGSLLKDFAPVCGETFTEFFVRLFFPLGVA